LSNLELRSLGSSLDGFKGCFLSCCQRILLRLPMNDVGYWLDE
jgi:hypothetical protein